MITRVLGRLFRFLRKSRGLRGLDFQLLHKVGIRPRCLDINGGDDPPSEG